MYHLKFDLLQKGFSIKNYVYVHNPFDQIRFFKKLTIGQGIPVQVPGHALLPVNPALSIEPGVLILPHCLF